MSLPPNLKTNCTARMPGDYAPQAAPAGRQRNKYNAVKVKLDGYTFDSKFEAERYLELRAMQKSGTIAGLVVHPEFLLQNAFQSAYTVVRPIIYEADFAYKREGKTCVEDVKGTATKVWAMKAKLFEKMFPNLVFSVIRK
jgi:hypothetical protein